MSQCLRNLTTAISAITTSCINLWHVAQNSPFFRYCHVVVLKVVIAVAAAVAAAEAPYSGELRTQQLKSHLVRTQSLNALPLKPAVGRYIAIHGTFTAWNFFLAYFYPSGPFTYIFPKSLPISPNTYVNLQDTQEPCVTQANTWLTQDTQEPCVTQANTGYTGTMCYTIHRNHVLHDTQEPCVTRYTGTMCYTG